MHHRPLPVSLQQATQDSPSLARLIDLAHESAQRLQAIKPLIPPALYAAVQAGPIEGTSWCLLLDNAATASKMRQLLPSLQAHLRTRGWEVNAIRLKIQPAR